MDKVVRKFIWKGGGYKGLHLVNWDRITRQKHVGGLVFVRLGLPILSYLGSLLLSCMAIPLNCGFGFFWINMARMAISFTRNLMVIAPPLAKQLFIQIGSLVLVICELAKAIIPLV